MTKTETIETDLTPLPRRYQAPGVDRAREVAAFYIVRANQPKHMREDYRTATEARSLTDPTCVGVATFSQSISFSHGSKRPARAPAITDTTTNTTDTETR